MVRVVPAKGVVSATLGSDVEVGAAVVALALADAVESLPESSMRNRFVAVTKSFSESESTSSTNTSRMDDFDVGVLGGLLRSVCSSCACGGSPVESSCCIHSSSESTTGAAPAGSESGTLSESLLSMRPGNDSSSASSGRGGIFDELN